MTPLVQWIYSAVVLVAGLPLLTIFIVGAQAFFNILGYNVLQVMLGTDDPASAMDELMDLTGVAGFDWILSIIQIVFIFILGFQLKIVTIAMGASVIGLMIGFAFRMFPKFGESLYETGIRITVFGVTGNFIAMVTLGSVVYFGTAIAPNSDVNQGFINVLAVILAVIVLWKSIGLMKQQLQVAVNGAVQFGRSLGDTISGNKDGHQVGGGQAQTDNEANDHKGHTRHGRNRKHTEQSSSESHEPAKGKPRSSQGSDGEDPNESKGHDDREERRHSSLGARLRRNSGDGSDSESTEAYPEEGNDEEGRPVTERQTRDADDTGYDDPQRGSSQQSASTEDSPPQGDNQRTRQEPADQSSPTRQEEPPPEPVDRPVREDDKQEKGKSDE